MTDQSIGTARLDVVVGTDGVSAGISTVQNSIRGLNADAQRQFDSMTKAQQRLAMGYVVTATNANKTKEEIRALSAEMKIGGPLGKQLADNLRNAGQAAQGLTKAFSGTNKTARELQFAMRGLPAQVTDIVTSLASGQRPLMVLLQQGGQLKDMFGGIGPAARAFGGAIAGLVNPYTLATAAIVGIGLAWKTAAEEAQAFNLSLIQTGHYSKLTANDLEDLAARLDKTTSATGRFAADVVNQVNATGRFTGEQVDVVSEAITRMAKAVQAAGGDADATIQDLIKSFTDLSKDPVDALLKLNETQHFLTRETLDQVESLKAQGREAEASEVAIRALADTINTRAPEMERNINSASAVFTGFKNAIAETADEAVNFFRRADESAQNFIRNHRGAFEAMRKAQAFVPLGGVQQNITDSLLKNSEVKPVFIGFKPGASPTVNSQEERERIKELKEAQDEWNSSIRQGESDAARLKRELDEVEAAGKRLGKTGPEIAKAQADIRAAFARKGRKPGNDGIEAATSKAAIQALEDQLKKEQGLLQNQARLLEANYAARNITTERYYAEQKRLAEENTGAQVRALEGEIAALQSRSLKGKDSINNARELAEKEAILAKVRADGANALQVLNIQEAAQIKQRQQANVAYTDALQQGKEAIKAELDSQILRISVGEREFEIRSRIIQLYRDEAKELLNLARQRDAGEIDEDTYRKRVDMLKRTIAEEVQIVRDGYDAMAEAQKNWANGAIKALADYGDAANDVAGQTYSLFSNVFTGLEDVVTDFIVKGKDDWRGFLDGLYEEAVRFTVRQGLNKVLQSFMPDSGDDSAAELSSAAGALAASAAPLYGAAAALSASAAALAAAGAGNAAGGVSGDSTGNWMSMLGSFLANENGNAFQGGNVIPFARGGIIDRPTTFPMRSGTGLMGEAGPEAIVPLKRMPNGRLGVETSGGSGPSSITFNSNTTVMGNMDRRAREAQRTDQLRLASRASRRNS